MRAKLVPSFAFGVVLTLLASLSVFATNFQNENRQHNEKKMQENLTKEVRHQLLLLPYYSVFDNLMFKVDGDNVTLLGQVVRPTLKSDAESAVKGIESVASVNNQIEVLPVSPMDDQLRRAVYRAVYGDTALSRYGMSALPSIHLIVKNGHGSFCDSLTLEGIANHVQIHPVHLSRVFQKRYGCTMADYMISPPSIPSTAAPRICPLFLSTIAFIKPRDSSISNARAT